LGLLLVAVRVIATRQEDHLQDEIFKKIEKYEMTL
jgi:hypothetical protein